MHTSSGARRVTRLAKFVVDLGWWLSIAGSVLLLALVLLWPVMTQQGLDPTINVPVSISDEGVRRLLSGPETAATGGVKFEGMDDVKGSLELRPLKWWLVLVGTLFALPGIAAGLFGLHLLRTFLRDILAGKVFSAPNARRLSWLGWLILIAGIALPLLQFGNTLFLVRRGGIPEVGVGVGIDSLTIFPGLLVLVIAAAWHYGVELRENHSLTV